MSEHKICPICGAEGLTDETYFFSNCGVVAKHNDEDDLVRIQPQLKCLQNQINNLKKMIQEIMPPLT